MLTLPATLYRIIRQYPSGLGNAMEPESDQRRMIDEVCAIIGEGCTEFRVFADGFEPDGAFLGSVEVTQQLVTAAVRIFELRAERDGWRAFPLCIIGRAPEWIRCEQGAAYADDCNADLRAAE